jgi:primary-amine oxidase
MIEKIALENEGVRAEIAKLKLPEGAVVICDPWIYGKVAPNSEERC